MADGYDLDALIYGSSSPKIEEQNEKVIASTVAEITENNASSGQIQFLSTLSNDDQEKIKMQAPVLLEKFVADENALLDFGTNAVENVNRVVSRILEEQKQLQLPEINDILRNANRELTGFSAKYGTIEKADFEEKENLFTKFFKSGKSKLNDLYYDSKNIEQKMDTLAATIVKQEDTLSKNIISGEMLVEENVKSIQPLVGVISVIEASIIEGIQEAEKLKNELLTITPNTPQATQVTDKMTRTTEVVNRLEQCHTEFVSRLYVAWANTPQLRNLLKTSSDLKSKLSLVRLNTIPTMKLTIAQLGFLQQLNATNKIANSIDEANNNALQMLADTSKSVIPEVERTVQNPSVTATTIAKLAQSIVEQNNGLISAIEDGRTKRREVESAIIQNAQVISDSVKLRDVKIIEGITNQAKILDQNLKGAEN
jgi:uncharacterized protein YaaN involved in tellurite resistance